MYLESVVSNAYHAAKGIAAPLLSYAITGTGYGALTSLAFVAGKYLSDRVKLKKKVRFKELMNESVVGSVLGSIGSWTYSAIQSAIPGTSLLSKLGRAAGTIVFSNPIFTGAYEGVDYIVKNRTLKGLKERYRKEYWKDLMDTTKYLGIPLGLTVNGYIGGYTGIIGADAAYRYIVAR